MQPNVWSSRARRVDATDAKSKQSSSSSPTGTRQLRSRTDKGDSHTLGQSVAQWTAHEATTDQSSAGRCKLSERRPRDGRPPNPGRAGRGSRQLGRQLIGGGERPAREADGRKEEPTNILSDLNDCSPANRPDTSGRLAPARLGSANEIRTSSLAGEHFGRPLEGARCGSERSPSGSLIWLHLHSLACALTYGFCKFEFGA